VTRNVRKPSRRRDSLLSHCLARAAVADYGGHDEAVEAMGAHAERLSKWSALRVGVKVSPKAARVAGFIVLWAVAMRDEGRDGYSITEYQRYWNENERQAYRLQKEFRELWPEYETPNELARQLLEYLDGRLGKRDVASLPMKLQVTA
jgi:hypothetical protein